jgi:D-alanyl-D-alanine carboxypeptidase/D-alanyl-D-alanine-endopeptidase (penicillin-binding protein 4)
LAVAAALLIAETWAAPLGAAGTCYVPQCHVPRAQNVQRATTRSQRNAQRDTPSRKTAPKAVEALRRDLDAVFSAPIMAPAAWGVAVRSLSTGEVLYERNAGKMMVPASNMKIVTLAAAARVIGWDAHFTTVLETDAPIEAGTLTGDLYVRGSGDPTINTRNNRGAAVFADWVAALQAAGIRRIDGRIVGDDNLFDDEGLGAGWAWDYLEADYAAPVGALEYNESVAALTVLPGQAAGEPAVVSLAAGSGLTVDNKATTAAAGMAETIRLRRRLDVPVLEVRGTVPVPPASAATDEPNRTLLRKVAVVNPTAYFVQSLKDALVAHGIAVNGDAVDIDDLPPAPPARAESKHVLARTESQPLRDIATVMMKVSQNLYAETLLKATGLAASGAGSSEAGRAAVLETLREWKLDERSLVMADGSGLSRYDYVTADLIASILERFYTDPRHRDSFMATLAIAGSDGTVLNRLKRTRAEGNARVKTGSISNMRALSGYVNTRDGEPLAFAILANDFTLPAATVNWITDLAVEIMANFTRQ